MVRLQGMKNSYIFLFSNGDDSEHDIVFCLTAERVSMKILASYVHRNKMASTSRTLSFCLVSPMNIKITLKLYK